MRLVKGRKIGRQGARQWRRQDGQRAFEVGLLGSRRTRFCGMPPAGRRFLARLEKRHGKGKALSILAHKIGRAVFYMLSRDTCFPWRSSWPRSADRARTSHTPKSSRQDRARPRLRVTHAP